MAFFVPPIQDILPASELRGEPSQHPKVSTQQASLEIDKQTARDIPLEQSKRHCAEN